ncbi:MAG: hypothetical protein ACTSWJ_07265 [Candidatus Heimdallarchaeaceae archaeon]
MNDFDKTNVLNSFGSLVLYLSSKLHMDRNISFILAGKIKFIVKHVSGMQDEPFSTDQENSLGKVELCFCKECSTSIVIDNESILTALEIIQEDEFLSKITLCFLKDEKCPFGVSLECNHESESILYIENSFTSITNPKNPKKQIILKDFENFGSSSIHPSNYRVKDYLIVLRDLIDRIEANGLKCSWRKKAKWLLRSDPEFIFQSQISTFLHNKFNDGRVEEEIGLAGGSLDFLIYGKSLLNKAILIEVKWIGKSVTKKSDDSITEQSKNNIIFGISQVLNYKKSYDLQRQKRGEPYLFVVDAQEKRAAYNELRGMVNEVTILWARLSALSPSKKAKLK